MVCVGLVVVALLTRLGRQLSLPLELFLLTTTPQLLLEVLLGLALVLLSRGEGNEVRVLKQDGNEMKIEKWG